MSLLEQLRGRPRARTALLVLAASVAVLVLCAFVIPGRGGGRGVPAAIVFFGVVLGLLNALTATGLIVVYRASRIINFAHTAMGAVGAVLVFNFLQFTGAPFLLVFPLGVLLGALTGLVFDLVFGRRFFRAPRLVLTVLTIAAAGFLARGAVLIDKLPFFPAEDERTGEQLAGLAELRARLPFEQFSFTVGDLGLTFGFLELFAIVVSLTALLLTSLFFRRTRLGVGVRAMSENLDRATLLGINSGTLSSVVWSLAGALAAAGVTLTGMLTSPTSATGLGAAILLPALAAAVIARMESLSVTLVAAVLISIVSQSVGYGLQDDTPLLDLGLFVVIAVGLLVQRRSILRSEDAGSSSWEATEEQRPIPKELLDVPGLRLTRWAILGVLAVAAVLFPFLASFEVTNLGSVIALNAIVALSLVVLTGWAGQVSLGQYAFVAIGAVVGGALTSRVGVPFWFAVPLATALTAALAALISIPALRVKGLFLAVATFALAVAVQSVLFSDRYFGWLLPEGAIRRPTLFLLDFDDERLMYYLCVGALAATVLLVVNLRRTRYGRIFIALRENEANVQAFGVSAVRAKVLAFAVSGALAGFAGAVFVHQQRGLSAASFTADASVAVFLLAIVGGVGSVTGALLGAAYFSVTNYLVTDPTWGILFGPAFTLYLLYAAPGGLISIVSKVRDSVLRIVAQRRQLVVPSLFADYDPDVLARRLIPLAPPLQASEAVAPQYALPSTLFDLDSRYADGDGGARQRESDLLGAAAQSAVDAPFGSSAEELASTGGAR